MLSWILDRLIVLGNESDMRQVKTLNIGGINNYYRCTCIAWNFNLLLYYIKKVHRDTIKH